MKACTIATNASMIMMQDRFQEYQSRFISNHAKGKYMQYGVYSSNPTSGRVFARKSKDVFGINVMYFDLSAQWASRSSLGNVGRNQSAWAYEWSVID